MRILRYKQDGTEYWGALRENEEVIPMLDPLTREVKKGPAQRLRDLELLAPVNPGQIVAVGLNYRDHAEELGMAIPENPILFMKPRTSVIGPNADILLPPSSKRVDFEAELGVVIGRRARKVPVDEAFHFILGYTCLNDVTARDLQKKDGQWTRAKSFDTFCPLGPWIETELDPSDLLVRLFLNGEPKQKSSTSNLIFSVPELVGFISHVMTLDPGDVIATGTPSGIGPMAAGDEVEVVIDGIGILTNRAVGDE
ncbi:MAG: fumarylacetoacetate hydrolase family protein [Deltaproteobacteria bacterium]|nr:fumarylacetoacetate hydrolase family protein [Deltaproteobacteria bacterium]